MDGGGILQQGDRRIKSSALRIRTIFSLSFLVMVLFSGRGWGRWVGGCSLLLAFTRRLNAHNLFLSATLLSVKLGKKICQIDVTSCMEDPCVDCSITRVNVNFCKVFTILNFGLASDVNGKCDSKTLSIPHRNSYRVFWHSSLTSHLYARPSVTYIRVTHYLFIYSQYNIMIKSKLRKPCDCSVDIR